MQRDEMFEPLSKKPALYRKLLECKRVAVLQGIQAAYETVERGRQNLAKIEQQIKELK